MSSGVEGTGGHLVMPRPSDHDRVIDRNGY